MTKYIIAGLVILAELYTLVILSPRLPSPPRTVSYGPSPTPEMVYIASGWSVDWRKVYPHYRLPDGNLLTPENEKAWRAKWMAENASPAPTPTPIDW